MDTLEKTISNLIADQFPAFYRDEGPLFIAFVKAYYEWMESTGQTIHHSRRLLEYKDIDETTDAFVVYFKEKYLRNIQLDTVQNTRQLVKHSLDLYRSKGTERSIELLFKIAFGVNASIYYPGVDLFKLSDGIWKIPNYIEVTLNSDNVLFNNKMITGLKSKARAFVEAVVRRNNNGILSDVFYVTDIEGTFLEGETVFAANITYKPTILGSLTALDIDINGIGSNAEIGQELIVISNTGIHGKAVVTELVDSTGLLSFVVEDGGYGFNSTSNVQISDYILTLPNTVANVIVGETIYQPLATLNYENANGFFNANDIISAYYANGSLQATAIILSSIESNTSAGSIFVEQISGNISANAIYTSGNLVGANLSLISGYVDAKASGTIMASNTQPDSIKVGIVDSVNAFYPNSYIYTTNSLINANLISVSGGSGGGFSISNNLLYPETVSLCQDQLGTYANVALGANAYGFVAAPSANLSSPLSTTLTFVNTLFGRIQLLIGVRPGSQYTEKPMIKVTDSRSLAFQKHDIILYIANSSATFAVGEVVEQAATGARLLVTSANSSVLTGQDLRVVNQFAAGATIVGDSSQATANVTYVGFDLSTEPVGNNAVISDNLVAGKNAIKKARVIDSGFGFINGQEVSIEVGDKTYSAYAETSALGTGEGYYAREGGFLSDGKKLFDGFYWQNFSYDVHASVALDKYQKLLKDVVHTAGYALFGTFVHEREIALDEFQKQTVITIS